MGKLRSALQQSQSAAGTNQALGEVGRQAAGDAKRNTTGEVSPRRNELRSGGDQETTALARVLETIERAVHDSTHTVRHGSRHDGSDTSLSAGDGEPISSQDGTAWLTDQNAIHDRVPDDSPLSTAEYVDSLELPYAMEDAIDVVDIPVRTFAGQLRSIDTDNAAAFDEDCLPWDQKFRSGEDFPDGKDSSDDGDLPDEDGRFFAKSPAPGTAGPHANQDVIPAAELVPHPYVDGANYADDALGLAEAMGDTQPGELEDFIPPECDDKPPTQSNVHELSPCAAWLDTPRVEESPQSLAAIETSHPIKPACDRNVVFDPTAIPGFDASLAISITTEDSHVADPVAEANKITGWHDEVMVPPEEVPRSHDAEDKASIPQSIATTEFETAIERALRMPRLRKQYQSTWAAIEGGRTSTTNLMVGFVSAESESHIGLLSGHLAFMLTRERGSHVLLIDGDMRNQQLSHRFELGHRPGLSDVIAGRLDWEEAVVPTSHNQVCVLPAGTTSMKPHEIDQRQLADLSNKWKEMFDVILIEVGDALAATAQPLYTLCDRCYLLVRLGQTSREIADDVVESMLSDGIPLKGCIVTNMP